MADNTDNTDNTVPPPADAEAFIKANSRCSPTTSVSLRLGTAEECLKTNPPNLSHLSNEHLQGLYEAVKEEYLRNRNLSDIQPNWYNKPKSVGHEGHEPQITNPADINHSQANRLSMRKTLRLMVAESGCDPERPENGFARPLR
jgi:hypothetical protein